MSNSHFFLPKMTVGFWRNGYLEGKNLISKNGPKTANFQVRFKKYDIYCLLTKNYWTNTKHPRNQTKDYIVFSLWGF